MRANSKRVVRAGTEALRTSGRVFVKLTITDDLSDYHLPMGTAVEAQQYILTASPTCLSWRKGTYSYEELAELLIPESLSYPHLDHYVVCI